MFRIKIVETLVEGAWGVKHLTMGAHPGAARLPACAGLAWLAGQSISDGGMGPADH